jgi:serine/threonine-protein kinase
LLLMALAGVGLLLWQRHRAGFVPLPPAAGGSGGSRIPVRPQPAPVAAPEAPSPAPDPILSPAPESAAQVDRAVASIQQLYQALSAKDFNQAQALFGSAAADQFDPEFFRQFERVTVQDLRSTTQVGSSVNLEGTVSFLWPDGSIQSESRSFSVDTASDPPRITASEFGRVLKPR